MNRKEEMLASALQKVRQELWVDYCIGQGRTDCNPSAFDTKPHIRIIDNALRASAAPEEGMNHRTCTCGQAGHGNAHEPGCPLSSYTGPTKYPRQTLADSGKAAPVGWFCPVDPDSATAFRWKRPQNGLCNSFGCKKQLVPVYAALAPATEDGGREEIGLIIDAAHWGLFKKYEHDFGALPLDTQHRINALLDKVSAILALSPSVGTPEMPSAQSKSEAT